MEKVYTYLIRWTFILGSGKITQCMERDPIYLNPGKYIEDNLKMG